jgi:23S rRNA pseudouridine2605 synthase
MDDPQQRSSVRDFLPKVAERLYPVGRLDYHSEGLLLLTNDGDLAHAVMRPGTAVRKTYLVKVRGVPGPAVLRRFRDGVRLDGVRTRPAEAALKGTTGERGGNAWVEVTLHEGRRNQIRRMFQMLGHPVQKLRRIRVGPIELGPLEPGESRELSPGEIEALRQSAAGAAKRPPRPRRKAGSKKETGRGGRPRMR